MLNAGELWLLRHAKSDGSQHLADFERPLNARGQKAATQLGIWLKSQRLNPQRIVASPAVRARETIDRVCQAAHWPEAWLTFDRRLYEADLNRLYQILADHARPGQILLLVGHNPGLEMLLHDLVQDPELQDMDKPMPTAALARLTITQPITPGSVAKYTVIRVKSLPYS
ncbi:MAG: histidine phosphatase family protein [Methylococcales bacterium]|nr:histidine phosphatase family protein [Methylococcales bacterium]